LYFPYGVAPVEAISFIASLASLFVALAVLVHEGLVLHSVRALMLDVFGAFGTIGGMTEHRLRLTDSDIALLVAALRARRAMTTGARAHRVQRLIDRLTECVRGNPKWIIDEEGQTHEEDLEEMDEK
jgi:hypothetical protein